ncbi:MAG: hypothetical protein IJQ81_07095 [Oscillibacter sp.]|nr:hypothetical protein [Oscillibacter sp.]MBR0281343.1 hypothetical protein [Oscillibacter sp.]
MNENALSTRFALLTEEGQKAVLDYMEYVLYRERVRAAQTMRNAFEDMDRILDGDTGGWRSEDDALAEIMAERRAARKRENSD